MLRFRTFILTCSVYIPGYHITKTNSHIQTLQMNNMPTGLDMSTFKLVVTIFNIKAASNVLHLPIVVPPFRHAFIN